MLSELWPEVRMPPTEVPDSNINFPKAEEDVLELWKELDAFQTSLKQSKGKPKYSFYDGPPFATGLPHYGHILAGTIKDIVTRYAHGRGYHVERMKANYHLFTSGLAQRNIVMDKRYQ